jgi:uncharacterized protein (DUF427 family)
MWPPQRTRYDPIVTLRGRGHVRISVNGGVVAETERPRILFETGLPPRHYFLPENICEEVLILSDKQTQCRYKGVASYYSVEVGGQRIQNLIWHYPEPIPEAGKIKHHLAFFNKKVDLEVDGEEQERPQTHWY